MEKEERPTQEMEYLQYLSEHPELNIETNPIYHQGKQDTIKEIGAIIEEAPHFIAGYDLNKDEAISKKDLLKKITTLKEKGKEIPQFKGTQEALDNLSIKENK